jgi:hypothetical protein
MNINLVDHGRMPNVEFPNMVQMAWFEIKIKDLNLNFKLNQALIPSSYYRYMVRVV